MRHVVHVLGTAQDGGLPQLGAATPADARARRDTTHRRGAASLCVLADDGRAFLIDVTPDIKEQERLLLGIPAYAARTVAEDLANHAPECASDTAPEQTDRTGPFDAILLTHAHVGHYAGLVHFGRECAATSHIPCHVTASMAAFLRTHAPWEQLIRLGNIDLRVLQLPARPEDGADFADDAFEPWPGLQVRVFVVPHRAEYTDTIGVSIAGTLLYVPDIDDWQSWPGARAEIERHAICLLDGTFFDASELPARRRSAIPHPCVTDTIARFRDLARGRRLIFTHLNHTNPLCDPGSPQAQQVTAAGFEIAREMMAFEL